MSAAHFSLADLLLALVLGYAAGAFSLGLLVKQINRWRGAE